MEEAAAPPPLPPPLPSSPMKEDLDMDRTPPLPGGLLLELQGHVNHHFVVGVQMMIPLLVLQVKTKKK